MIAANVKPNARAASRLGMEVKYIDTTFNTQSCVSPGTILAVASPTQGVGQLQRIGDHVKLRAVEFNYGFYPGTAPYTCRMILFQWNINSALTLPTALYVLDPLYNTTALAPFSPYSYPSTEQEKFNVIYDKTVEVSVGKGNASFRELIPLGSRSIEFDVAATTATGNLYLLWISDAAAAAPTTTGIVRVFYSEQ